ncbi:hypothetical protein V2J09_010335 [Rumex salicifolius]
MSSIQVIFSAAIAAVSGAAVILLALKLHKSLPPSSPEIQFRTDSSPPPRSCISTGEKKVKKKKVRFAKDVVEPSGNNEEFRRRIKSAAANSALASTVAREKMPANRAALYNGILRDRVVHRRLGYSY